LDQNTSLVTEAVPTMAPKAAPRDAAARLPASFFAIRLALLSCASRALRQPNPHPLNAHGTPSLPGRIAAEEIKATKERLRDAKRGKSSLFGAGFLFSHAETDIGQTGWQR
jgi:hypothetical protein